MDVLTQEGAASSDLERAVAPRRVRRSGRLGMALCAVLLLAGVATWLWEDLTFRPSVYVVGDSITSLSQTALSSVLAEDGYQPTISATPGAKLGQAQGNITTLAQN